MTYNPRQAPSGMKDFDELRKWVEEEFRRVQQGLAQTTPVKVVDLPIANVKNAGMTAYVIDSNTNAWGTAVVGGGANKVLVFCNGASWTVAGK